jgi:hypothetical protein
MKFLEAKQECDPRGGGPAHRSTDQSDCEKRASRNSPSLAVVLNCGIGSSSLNADANALDRLQIVRDLAQIEEAWDNLMVRIQSVV